MYLASSLLALRPPFESISKEDYYLYLTRMDQEFLRDLSEQTHFILKGNPNASIRLNDEFLLDPIVLDIYSKLAVTSTT